MLFPFGEYELGILQSWERNNEITFFLDAQPSMPATGQDLMCLFHNSHSLPHLTEAGVADVK